MSVPSTRSWRYAAAVALGVVTVGVVVLSTTPRAFAGESYYAWCDVALPVFNPTNCLTSGTQSRTQAAVASYDDAEDAYCAKDTHADGRSAIVRFWRKGSPDLKYIGWNHSGNGTTRCFFRQGSENQAWVMDACIGEWADNPSNRVILDCGANRDVLQ